MTKEKTKSDADNLSCAADDYICRLTNLLVSQHIYQARVQKGKFDTKDKTKIDGLLRQMGLRDREHIITIREQFTNSIDRMLANPHHYEQSLARLNAEVKKHQQSQHGKQKKPH